MKYTILIAEDDYFYRRLFVDYFSRSGEFKLILCKDSDETENALVNQCPDVAVLDYHLPGKTADELIHFLEKQGLNIPKVVITGDESIDTERTVRSCRIDYYFVKPVNLADLENVMRKLIDQKQSSLTKFSNDRKSLV